MPTETARVFIAIDIGEDIRQALAELQRRLRSARADVRWVDPHNIHLTLAFLGDIPTPVLPVLRKAMEEAARGVPPFVCETEGAGIFGRPRSPRVVWAGIRESPPLADMRSRIVAALRTAEIAFDDAKPFSPHLTIGRVKSPKHADALCAAVGREMHARYGIVDVAEVLLMQSELRPAGADYSVLHRAALAKD